MPASSPHPLLRPATRLAMFALALGFGPIPSAIAQPWTPIPTSGTPPAVRRLEGLIVDELGSRMIVVGGEYADLGTWALSLVGPAEWTNLNMTAPAGSGDGVQAVYDPVGRRMVLVMPDCAVWALDLANPAAWQLLIAAGTGPAPRRYPVVVHDAARNRLILFGGGPDTGFWSDVWALNLSGAPAWQQLTPPGIGPAPRWAAVGVYDAGSDRLVIFSGSTQSGGLKNDVWALSLANPVGWVELHPAGPLPQARFLSAAIFDPVTSELVMFDGHNGSVGLSDLWTLDLASPTSWSQVIPSGPVPPLRWSHRAVYHQASASMITYGGWNGTIFRDDVWFLSRPAPGGPPRVFGFTPAGGMVGDEVTILGLSLENPLEVTIGGAVAQVVSSSSSSIHAIVPAGAVTGPISVTTAAGTAVSSGEYFVGDAPIIEQALPDSGRAGETIEIRGRALATTNRISFGGTTAAPFTVLSDTSIAATLDTLATTGPIHVTTLVGSSQSAFTFQVILDDPRPRLLSVRDVENDQGGRVMLRWRASDFDKFRYRSITRYRVWRRAPLSGLTADVATSNGWSSSRALGQAAADPGVFWESLAELPAAFLSGYAYAAATLQDSTDIGNPYTAYFVQALTNDVFKFYNSSPDSGYSVDNLAPPTPTQVAVLYGPSANTLHWRGRNVADLRGYRIHRGADAFFVPTSANLVVTTSDTSYADIAGSHFYKLAALDLHGNVSRYIAISPDRPVATLATFFRSLREHGLARVIWFSGGNPNLAARVYRCTESTDWVFVGDLLADGNGYLTYDDRAVLDASRYGYRLGIVEPEESENFLGETWLDPLAVEFAFAGRLVNPSVGGRVACTLAIPASVRAEVRLFDITGREVERQVLEAGNAGERSVRFGEARRLRAGVYLLRAASGAVVMTRRVVVLD